MSVNCLVLGSTFTQMDQGQNAQRMKVCSPARIVTNLPYVYSRCKPESSPDKNMIEKWLATNRSDILEVRRTCKDLAAVPANREKCVAPERPIFKKLWIRE